MSAAAPLTSTSGSGTASGHNKLVRAAARTYREFIWSVCFGLVTVASVSRPMEAQSAWRAPLHARPKHAAAARLRLHATLAYDSSLLSTAHVDERNTTRRRSWWSSCWG